MSSVVEEHKKAEEPKEERALINSSKGMGNLLCQNRNERKKMTVRNVSAFEAGNEVSSSVVVEMSSRRLSSEDTGSRKLDNDNEDEMKTDEESGTNRAQRTIEFEPSVLSRLFMMWVLPFVKRSYFAPLRGDEMPRLRSELRSKTRYMEAKMMWDDMVEHWRAGTGPKPSLYRMMWRMNRAWCVRNLTSLSYTITVAITTINHTTTHRYGVFCWDCCRVF